MTRRKEDRSDSEDPIQSSRNGGDGASARRKSRAGAAAFPAKSRHAGSGSRYLRWRCRAWRRLDLSPCGTRSSLTNGGRSLARAEHVSRSRYCATGRGGTGSWSLCRMRQCRVNRRFDLSVEGRSGNGERSDRFFKTTAARFAAFQEKLKSLHPYDTPEIISFRIDDGSPDYLRWVAENCATSESQSSH